MGKLDDLLGTLGSIFQIGIGGSGARTLRFKGLFQGDLSWTPTAARAIDLPDASGTLVVLSSAGMVPALLIRDQAFQRRRAEIYSDFIGGFGEWSSVVSGTGAANSVTATSTIPSTQLIAGIANQSTGTTATGRAALTSSPVAFRLADLYRVGSTRVASYFRAVFSVAIVSTGVESFVYRVGFIDNNSTESTDGCFLRINADNTSQFVCRNNNTETVSNLSSLSIAAGATYNVEITVSDLNLATLKIFQSPLNTGEDAAFSTTATITTNIPSGSTRLTGAGSYLQKTLGITARTIDLDFMYAGIDT